MKNIAVFPNSYKDPKYETTRRIVRYLLSFGARIFLRTEHSIGLKSPGIHYYDGDFPKEVEMILVIGGDGSVLDASVYAIGAGIPLLGVNLGRLGYLAEIDADECEILSRLFTDEFSIREHMTFHVSLVRDGEEMDLVRCAVNDVVISQAEGEGMSELRLEDGHGNHLTYLADGIIVATPLGSTAYSLSAGGPIIDSSLSAMCVTPICAHSLFSRSILFPTDIVLSVKNISHREGKMKVSIDGGENYTLEPEDLVKISRSEKTLQIITLKNESAVGILCRKMKHLNQRV